MKNLFLSKYCHWVVYHSLLLDMFSALGLVKISKGAGLKLYSESFISLPTICVPTTVFSPPSCHPSSGLDPKSRNYLLFFLLCQSLYLLVHKYQNPKTSYYSQCQATINSYLNYCKTPNVSS